MWICNSKQNIILGVNSGLILKTSAILRKKPTSENKQFNCDSCTLYIIIIILDRVWLKMTLNFWSPASLPGVPNYSYEPPHRLWDAGNWRNRSTSWVTSPAQTTVLNQVILPAGILSRNYQQFYLLPESLFAVRSFLFDILKAENAFIKWWLFILQKNLDDFIF